VNYDPNLSFGCDDVFYIHLHIAVGRCLYHDDLKLHICSLAAIFSLMDCLLLNPRFKMFFIFTFRDVKLT